MAGWKLQFIKWDECHILKLGICRWAVAAGILDLAERGLFGQGRQEDRLAVAWAQFKMWARCRRIQCNARKFTPARLGIGSGDFLEMSSKAFNTRVFVHWLADVTRSAPDVDRTDHNKVLAVLFDNMARMFSIMEQSKSLFFTQSEATSFITSGNIVLGSYSWLACDALEQRQLRFPLRPKHHALKHLILGVGRDRRNPKRFGCIMDEDHLGRLIKVAAKCHRRTVAEGVLLRYAIKITRHWMGQPGARTVRVRLRPRRLIVRPLPHKL
jgi:hypothetical protein